MRCSASCARCFSTIAADLRRGTLALTCILASLAAPCGRVARAQPVQTWGVPPRPGAPAPAPRRRPRRRHPRSRPRSTLGTPTPGSTSAARRARRPPSPCPRSMPPSADARGGTRRRPRTPGAIGLKYTLEGVEVRGNTTTLPRVVLRYVPFHAGDVLDVDDPELELTRFRLLGTGFFRDVQLSLRRGTQRGYVVLVVDVVERNTIVVNDVWLGLSEDVEPNPNGTGTARPLTAYGGARRHRDQPRGHRHRARRRVRRRRRAARPPRPPRRPAVPPHQLDRRDGAPLQLRARLLRQPRRPRQNDPTQPASHGLRRRRSTSASAGASAPGTTSASRRRSSSTTASRTSTRRCPLAASDHRGLDIEPIDFMLLPELEHPVDPPRDVRQRHARRAVPADAGAASSAPPSMRRSRPLGSDYPYTKLVAPRRRSGCPLPVGARPAPRRLRRRHLRQTRRSSSASTSGDFSDLLPDRVLDLELRPAPGAEPPRAPTSSRSATATTPRKLDAEYRVPLYRGTRSIYGVDFFGSVGLYGVAQRPGPRRPAARLPGPLHGPRRPDVQPRAAHRHAGRRLRPRHRQPRRVRALPGHAGGGAR